MRIRHLAVMGTLLLSPVPVNAAACGGSVACTVTDGSYRIEMPAATPAKGAYIFFHGYKSSAALQMQHRALVEVAHAHGLAFVAVDGLNGTWSHDGAPGAFRDEDRFVGHVLDDLTSRFGFTGQTMVVGGFSQGGSMAFYTLCHQGDRLAGAVTFSGVFWNPLPKPEDCVPQTPPLVHFHGSADRTFPLTGRAIGSYHQGDTRKSIAILRARNGCAAPDEARHSIGGIACEVSPGCNRGSIALCIHDRGHEVRPSLLDAGLSAIGF